MFLSNTIRTTSLPSVATILLAVNLAVAGSGFAQAPTPGGTPIGATSSRGADSNIDRNLEVDFLLNYYDQDGENSPVTGGIGTEDAQVVGPVFLVRWDISNKWRLNGTLGLDNVTSASTDNIDLGEDPDIVSGASKQDSRVFFNTNFVRSFGSAEKPQTVGFSLGVSNEYDYQSASFGLSWSREFNQRNTSVSASLTQYMDTIDLYGIDGIRRDEADRDTTDISLGMSQILGRKTIASFELSYSIQDGFLSTPFHEVILQNDTRVAERFPSERTRMAFGVRLNHALTDRVILRSYFRIYDDDFDVQAQTIEFEPHFRLPTRREVWLFPILRFHSQDGASFFGLPGTHSTTDQFFTADRDLSDFDSEKFGLGVRLGAIGPKGGRRGMRDIEIRATSYSRDDGLQAFNLSIGLGWNFN